MVYNRRSADTCAGSLTTIFFAIGFEICRMLSIKSLPRGIAAAIFDLRAAVSFNGSGLFTELVSRLSSPHRRGLFGTFRWSTHDKVLSLSFHAFSESTAILKETLSKGTGNAGARLVRAPGETCLPADRFIFKSGTDN